MESQSEGSSSETYSISKQLQNQGDDEDIFDSDDFPQDQGVPIIDTPPPRTKVLKIKVRKKKTSPQQSLKNKIKIRIGQKKSHLSKKSSVSKRKMKKPAKSKQSAQPLQPTQQSMQNSQFISQLEKQKQRFINIKKISTPKPDSRKYFLQQPHPMQSNYPPQIISQIKLNNQLRLAKMTEFLSRKCTLQLTPIIISNNIYYYDHIDEVFHEIQWRSMTEKQIRVSSHQKADAMMQAQFKHQQSIKPCNLQRNTVLQYCNVKGCGLFKEQLQIQLQVKHILSLHKNSKKTLRSQKYIIAQLERKSNSIQHKRVVELFVYLQTPEKSSDMSDNFCMSDLMYLGVFPKIWIVKGAHDAVQLEKVGQEILQQMLKIDRLSFFCGFKQERVQIMYKPLPDYKKVKQIKQQANSQKENMGANQMMMSQQLKGARKGIKQQKSGHTMKSQSRNKKKLKIVSSSQSEFFFTRFKIPNEVQDFITYSQGYLKKAGKAPVRQKRSPLQTQLKNKLRKKTQKNSSLGEQLYQQLQMDEMASRIKKLKDISQEEKSKLTEFAKAKIQKTDKKELIEQLKKLELRCKTQGRPKDQNMQ